MENNSKNGKKTFGNRLKTIKEHPVVLTIGCAVGSALTIGIEWIMAVARKGGMPKND